MLCAGSVGPRGRYSIDERILFERLWRGALCQALSDKTTLRSSARRASCCCHCHCMQVLEPIHGNCNDTPNSKTMRSVVRYGFFKYCMVFFKNINVNVQT